MSQPVLNSNANSAMINTLLNTESLRIPAEYSTKIIDYPHAVSYTKIDAPANTTISENSQQTIQLLKYGIATQILLCFTKKCAVSTSGDPAVSVASLTAGDIFRIISRVELMSSSRVISTLTSEGLQAQIASYSQSQLIPVYRNAVRARSYSTANTGASTATRPEDPTPDFKFVIPLRFGLLEQEGVLNLSFLENVSVRITYGKVDHLLTGTGTPTIDDVSLRVRFQVYPEEAMAKILSSNFSENDLNVLSSRQYLENSKQQNYTPMPGLSSPNNRLQRAFIDLNNVDVISKFYVIVRCVGDNANHTTARGASAPGTGINLGNPLKITALKLFASGQEILALDQNEIEYAVLEENGLAQGNSGVSVGIAGTGCELDNIAVLPMGLYTNDMVVSNAISLRELNNCRLQVEWYALGTASATSGSETRFQVDVVEDALAIYNIASSTGRIGLSLSN